MMKKFTIILLCISCIMDLFVASFFLVHGQTDKAIYFAIMAVLFTLQMNIAIKL